MTSLPASQPGQFTEIVGAPGGWSRPTSHTPFRHWRACFLLAVVLATRGLAATPEGTWRNLSNPEGMSAFDVDADGKVDLLAGNTWFKHTLLNKPYHWEAPRVDVWLNNPKK